MCILCVSLNTDHLFKQSLILCQCNFPMRPIISVGLSDCHNLLKDREINLQVPFRIFYISVDILIIKGNLFRYILLVGCCLGERRAGCAPSRLSSSPSGTKQPYPPLSISIQSVDPNCVRRIR